MQQTATDVLQLVRSAGVKLAGHWPTLLALTLAGFTVKLATLKLAQLAGGIGWAAAVFVSAFTAAGLLAAILFMFRLILPARQWPEFTVVLAPFLVVFIASNHFDGYAISPALERQVTMDLAAGSVLIAAIVLRWLMPVWPALDEAPWAVWIRRGLDVCWMSLLAFTVASHPLSIWLTELAEPAAWVFHAAFTVLIVPLAWLATGALAMGMRPAALPQLTRRAGLPLTLATCLLIVVVQMIPLLLWQVERLVAGAQDPDTFWFPLSGLLGAANSAVGVLLVVCLVAAFLARSVGDQAGIAGQRGAAHDAHGDRLGVSGRDEEDGHLIGA